MSEVRVKSKRSRENTREEKRRMNASRKKKLRNFKKLAVAEVKKTLKTEVKLKESAQKESAKYKSMSRTYWERWRWELEKRKEAMVQEMQSRLLLKHHSSLRPSDQGS